MTIIVDKQKALKQLMRDDTDYVLAKDKRAVLLQLFEKHKSFYDIVTEYKFDPAGVEQVAKVLLTIGDYDLRSSDERKLYDFFRPDQIADAVVLSYYPSKLKITEANLEIMMNEELGEGHDWKRLRNLDTQVRYEYLRFWANLTRQGVHVNNENGRQSHYDSFTITQYPALSSHNNTIIVIGG